MLAPDSVRLTVDPPLTLPVPAGIESDFRITHGFIIRVATAIVSADGVTVDVIAPPAAPPISSIRYLESQGPWFNATGGRLADFNLSVPFP